MPGFESRDVEVPNHYARKSGVDVVAEWNDVGCLKVDERAVDERQRFVRVRLRVAVSGEVLCHRHDAVVFEAARVGYCFAAHVFRVFAERAGADNRVAGIAVDVEHGGEVDVNAHLSAFGSHFRTVFVEKTFVADSAESHVPRKLRGVFYSHRKPPFAIDTHQHGHLRDFVGVVAQRSIVVGISRAEVDAADVVTVDEHFDFFFCFGELFGVNGLRNELPDAVFGIHSSHHAVCPSIGCALVGEYNGFAFGTRVECQKQGCCEN